MRSSLFYLLLSFSSIATAAINSDGSCSGRIVEILKWSDHSHSSILIEGTRRYLQLPSESDQSIALMAFEKGLPVKIKWRSTSHIKTTDCREDWSHYETLDGLIAVQAN